MYLLLQFHLHHPLKAITSGFESDAAKVSPGGASGPAWRGLIGDDSGSDPIEYLRFNVYIAENDSMNTPIAGTTIFALRPNTSVISLVVSVHVYCVYSAYSTSTSISPCGLQTFITPC